MAMLPLELLQDTEEMLSGLTMAHIDDSYYCQVCSNIRCGIEELFALMDEEVEA